ncbi:nuclease-related domain-containing protein [Bacillus suaedaesalsae]|uniref:NERD domain-containing protein n=1 Tax=Bacillus suaedaesalsae TaxID=2810349 RepID=A0ABS2DGW8_9BACI|nr:nuclease-related domain-containing protein [Bacillus suaedaesalsae]MBM6617722.1 NERD domain-containing protein [Bacillus suaedaesalsae]
MIVKRNEKPRVLLQLEALTKRLPKNHPKQSDIQKNLARRRAGFNGENSLDYYLDYLSSENYHIFHDLRLHDGVHHFQIDLLILTKNFILIIEVKNISGVLNFDPTFNQLIRYHGEKEESFPDPILQAKRHKAQLYTWLSSNKSPLLPIETLVLISNPSSTIKVLNNSHLVSQSVIRSPNLLKRLTKIERKYNVEILTGKELKKLSRLLIKKHNSLHSNILEQYDIKTNELNTGVFCSVCNYLPLKRIYGYWYCSACRSTSKSDNIHALKEYALLINPLITKREMAEFLHIEY